MCLLLNFYVILALSLELGYVILSSIERMKELWFRFNMPELHKNSKAAC